MPKKTPPDMPRPHSNLLVLCQGAAICLAFALLYLSLVTVAEESRLPFAKIGICLVLVLFLFGLPVSLRSRGLARLGWLGMLCFGTSEGLRYALDLLTRR